MTPPLTYAIGDIHGCAGKLRALWDALLTHAAARPAKFVFLGDYIDRGPDSRGVVAFLLALEKERPGDVVCLKGNHENMHEMAIGGDRPIVAWWIGNGGGQTLESYGVERAADLPSEHLHWLAARPLTHDDGQRLFVHAGVNPALPINAQSEQDLLWIREPFLSHEGAFPRFIVHGHTPLRTARPDVRRNRVNLDTGAVFGGSLTAAVFAPGHVEPVEFLFAP